MTVGIASICYQNNEPRVLITADRMVTFGRQAGIEFEDTESKIAPLIQGEEVTAAAVGSGASNYIDEIIRRIVTHFNDPETEHEPTMSHVLDVSLYYYQETVRETIQNQVMEPLGYSYTDLRNNEISIPPEIQKTIAKRSLNIREEVEKRAHILVGGVGTNGPAIYHITGMDYLAFTNMGYAVIGSGADSARLTFIRRRYNRNCDHSEGIFTILEAKTQAEERQGVGQKLDLVSLSQDGIYRFDEGAKDELQQLLKRIDDEERYARENILDSWDPDSGAE